jgi:hypothetical protein
MDLNKYLSEPSQQIQIKSAIDPLFKMGIVLLGMGIVSSYNEKAVWLTIAVFTLACLFLLFALIAWAYFAKNDRSMLRSESYSIKSQIVAHIGDKDKLILINESLELIENPNFMPLPEGESIKKEANE